MPNPLIGAHPANVGTPADNRPHATPPLPEAYVGHNNPYRGTETHGVEKHLLDPEAVPGWDDDISGEFEVDTHEPVEPVPVRVVREFSRELRRFTTNQDIVPIGGVIRQICGRNPRRIALTIWNLHAADLVYFMAEQNAGGNFIGAPIYPGAAGKVQLVTQDPVYLVVPAAGANVIPVAICEEYAVQER